MNDAHVSVRKVPKFAGNGKKFCVFDSQFRAVCILKNCNEAWDESFNKELPTKFDAVLKNSDPAEKKHK